MRSLVLAIVIAVGVVSPAFAQIQQFIGSWENADPGTRSILRLTVGATSGAALEIRAWGACTPNPCDWGSVNAYAYGPDVRANVLDSARAVTAIYVTSLSETILVLRSLSAGQLAVDVHTRFTDRTRPAYTRTETFVARRSADPPAARETSAATSPPPPGSKFIGSEDIAEHGASPGYPRAQSFLAPGTRISAVALHMRGAVDRPWQVRIVSALPDGVPGQRGRVDQADLERKTLGTATIQASAAGWVYVRFTAPIASRPGQMYFLFVDGHDTDRPTRAAPSMGSPAYWSGSTPGLPPGPYPHGAGWVYVYSWSDNSNYRPEIVKHKDYAFRVYED